MKSGLFNFNTNAATRPKHPKRTCHIQNALRQVQGNCNYQNSSSLFGVDGFERISEWEIRHVAFNCPRDKNKWIGTFSSEVLSQILGHKKSRPPQDGFQPTTHETAYAAFKEALKSFLYARPIGTLNLISLSRISIVLPFTAETLSRFTIKDR